MQNSHLFQSTLRGGVLCLFLLSIDFLIAQNNLIYQPTGQIDLSSEQQQKIQELESLDYIDTIQIVALGNLIDNEANGYLEFDLPGTTYSNLISEGSVVTYVVSGRKLRNSDKTKKKADELALRQLLAVDLFFENLNCSAFLHF